jgi:lysophospholipase L1-like esterase
MIRIPRAAAAAAALVAATLLAACDKTPEVVAPATPSGGARFASYVALGNSITAGFQSGGINDSTQQESYAALLADAMGTRYAYAQISAPGCPPPVTNFQTQSRGSAGTTVFTSTTCGLRDPASVTPVLNNVAVPNAYVVDPISRTTANSNALTTIILGGVSQVAKALQADPTFASVWLGNNDVLAAGVSGVITPLAGVSPGVTPAATFATTFDEVIDSLAAAPRLEGGVLIGVINVTGAPILFPAAALANPAFKAGFDSFAGRATTVLANCTGSPSLISFQLAGQIRAGTHPPVISCAKGAFAPSALVGELFVLDAAEQTAINAAVTAYNAAISARATALGWAYYDPNPALQALRANGSIPAVPNLGNPTAPFGAYISLDGVHPRRPAHVLVANGIITAINAKYGTTLPAVE